MKFAVGDCVRVVEKRYIDGVLAWPGEMDDTLGEEGRVFETSQGEVGVAPHMYSVVFDDGADWWYLEESLALAGSSSEHESFKKGDRVRVVAKHAVEGVLYWLDDDMDLTLGAEGVVTRIEQDDPFHTTYRVALDNGAGWWYLPQSLVLVGAEELNSEQLQEG